MNRYGADGAYRQARRDPVFQRAVQDAVDAVQPDMVKVVFNFLQCGGVVKDQDQLVVGRDDPAGKSRQVAVPADAVGARKRQPDRICCRG